MRARPPEHAHAHARPAPPRAVRESRGAEAGLSRLREVKPRKAGELQEAGAGAEENRPEG